MVFESAIAKAAARLLPSAAESLLPGAGKAATNTVEGASVKAGETATMGSNRLAQEGIEALLQPTAMISKMTGPSTARVASTRVGQLETSGQMFNELGERAVGNSSQWLAGNSEAQVSKMWMERFFMDPARRLPLTEKFMGAGVERQFVKQGEFAVAPAGVALETNGLHTCGGLIVQDSKRGMHYLAHADLYHDPAALLRSLKGFDLGASKLFVMPGSVPSIMPQNVIRGLLREPQALANIKFLDWDKVGRFSSVLSHEGKLFIP